MRNAVARRRSSRPAAAAGCGAAAVRAAAPRRQAAPSIPPSPRTSRSPGAAAGAHRHAARRPDGVIAAPTRSTRQTSRATPTSRDRPSRSSRAAWTDWKPSHPPRTRSPCPGANRVRLRLPGDAVVEDSCARTSRTEGRRRRGSSGTTGNNLDIAQQLQQYNGSSSRSRTDHPAADAVAGLIHRPGATRRPRGHPHRHAAEPGARDGAVNVDGNTYHAAAEAASSSPRCSAARATCSPVRALASAPADSYGSPRGRGSSRAARA